MGGDRTAFEVGRLYQPIKAIADVITGSQEDVFVRLPALVAYWPMGIRGNGLVYEHGGSGIQLTQTGICPTGYDGNSFAHIGNGINYVKSASSLLDLTGLETWVSSSLRGVTVGGWFMIDALPPSQAGVATKYGVLTDYGYALVVSSTGVIQSVVSSNGSAVTFVNSSPVPTAQWVFLTLRFTPGTELAVFVDGDKTTKTVSIPASVNVSSQAFEIGRYANDDNFIAHGKARDVFVCAAAISDAIIEQIRLASVP